MKTLSILFSVALAIFVCACGGDSKKSAEDEYGYSDQDIAETPSADQKESSRKGVGEVKHVDLTDPLDEAMIKSGKMIYEMKCSACHKLTDQRVVGPGWAGITNRRTPEWIMNMITNVDMMLASDAEAQALLEECLVRMPNQNVSVGDARSILEYMRQNDVEKVGKKDEAASS